MPEVPQVQNNVTPEPLKKVRPIPGFEEYAPEGAFGGGKSGRPGEELAQTSGELLKKHSDEANDHYMIGVGAQANEVLYKHVYGPDGVINKPITDQKTIDAVVKSVRDDWDKIDVKNDDQRKMYDKMREKLDGELIESLYKKSSSDVIEQGKQNAEKFVGSATTLAMGDFDHAEDRLKEVKGVAGVARMGKEEVEPDFNYRVTHAMLDAGQIERAKQWMENPDHYFGKMADKMDKDFETAKKSHDVISISNAITSSSPDAKTAMQMVDKIDIPGVDTKKIRDRVNGFFKAHTQAMQDTELKSFLNISNNIGKQPGSDPTKMTGFSSLSARHQAELIRQSDPNFQGNLDTAKVWKQMTSQEIKGMSKENFYDDIYSKLPRADRAEAEKTWKFEQDPTQKAGASHVSDMNYKTDLRNALITGGIVPKGLKPSEWSSDDLTNFDNLRISIDSDRDQFKASHGGKDPTRGEVKDMIRDAISTKYKEGMFGGTTTGGFVPIDGVDGKHQAAILHRFDGVELSKGQVQEYYKAWMDKDVKKLEELDKEFRNK